MRGPLGRAAGAAVALALVAAACGAGRAKRAEPVEGFDAEKLVDVLQRDAIPAIDDPSFESLRAASGWLTEESPVLAVAIGNEARAYPLGILTRHEIVNDVLAGRSLAVTYCPLCNTGIVYDRRVGGRTLTFGVSGKLYLSDLVMYDRQTESLWPQAMGRAVLGPLAGAKLEPMPSGIASLADFRASFPEGRVLSRPAGRAYGSNPYVGYDSQDAPYPDFFLGEPDVRLPAMERVVGIAIGREARAYPYGRLARGGNPAVVGDRVGATDLVVLWGGAARSALDAGAIADGERVGATGVFEPVADGRPLTLETRGGLIVDRETRTTWTVLGVGAAGKLRGARLSPVHHVDAFWFAWSAFVPFTDVWKG